MKIIKTAQFANDPHSHELGLSLSKPHEKLEEELDLHHDLGGGLEESHHDDGEELSLDGFSDEPDMTGLDDHPTGNEGDHDVLEEQFGGDPLDIEIELDPSKAQSGGLPLEIDVNDQEIPLDDMIDVDDFDLGLHDIDSPDLDFNEMSFDGELDGDLNMDEMGDGHHPDGGEINDITESNDVLPDHAGLESDGLGEALGDGLDGLDGLLVIEDEHPHHLASTKVNKTAQSSKMNWTEEQFLKWVNTKFFGGQGVYPGALDELRKVYRDSLAGAVGMDQLQTIVQQITDRQKTQYRNQHGM